MERFKMCPASASRSLLFSVQLVALLTLAATGCGGTDPEKQMCIDADRHCGGGGNFSRCHDNPSEYEICTYECVLDVDCVEFYRQLDDTKSAYHGCLAACWRDYGGKR